MPLTPSYQIWPELNTFPMDDALRPSDVSHERWDEYRAQAALAFIVAPGEGVIGSLFMARHPDFPSVDRWFWGAPLPPRFVVAHPGDTKQGPDPSHRSLSYDHGVVAGTMQPPENQAVYEVTRGSERLGFVYIDPAMQAQTWFVDPGHMRDGQLMLNAGETWVFDSDTVDRPDASMLAATFALRDRSS